MSKMTHSFQCPNMELFIYNLIQNHPHIKDDK